MAQTVGNQDRLPERECDVIMKGGITSGVVYPKAILRLSAQYRFRQIGGASAGAIAAALTAAAEYARSTGAAKGAGEAACGFPALDVVREYLQTDLLSLFQPAPSVRNLFDIALAAAGGRWRRALGLLLADAWKTSVLAVVFLIYLTATVLYGIVGTHPDFWAWLAGAGISGLFFLVGFGGYLGWRAWRLGERGLGALKKLDYGLCPGTTQGRGGPVGLSNWLADQLQVAAGLPPGGKDVAPLTFGDLWQAGRPAGAGAGEGGTADGGACERSIDLHMMTTNLGMRRPHVLPDLKSSNWYFDEGEFRKLFPAWVVDWMVRDGGCLWSEDKKFLAFPRPENLPVIVATRMSLSFPLLFSAVPLYRYNHREKQWQRVLFSDGGLSSNFPIHFFDAHFPGRPTFGVSLDRQRPGDSSAVRLPMKAVSGGNLPVDAIDSPLAFAVALLEAAKDWRDNLLSKLVGYRERVAHIHLDEASEGGLNLQMSEKTIEKLTDYGDRAGVLLTGQPGIGRDVEPFRFDDHRWRRYLVVYAGLEDLLTGVADQWGDPVDPDSFARFAQDMQSRTPQGFNLALWRRKEMFKRMEALAALVGGWGGSNALAAIDKPNGFPKQRPHFRLVPNSDLPEDGRPAAGGAGPASAGGMSMDSVGADVTDAGIDPILDGSPVEEDTEPAPEPESSPLLPPES